MLDRKSWLDYSVKNIEIQFHQKRWLHARAWLPLGGEVATLLGWETTRLGSGGGVLAGASSRFEVEPLCGVRGQAA